jgi:AcrR family transcriptional regulator
MLAKVHVIVLEKPVKTAVLICDIPIEACGNVTPNSGHPALLVVYANFIYKRSFVYNRMHMPRPRTIDDASLLDAALALMQEHGPASLTFASMGKVSGLAPATLVQRFGSKEGLLEAALLRAWDELDARTAAGDAEAPITPEGAISLLVGLSSYGDHDRYADSLLILREDFRNPQLRERGGRWGNNLALILGRRLTTDLDRQHALGRLMANQWQGALLWWGFSREGRVEDFVAAELEAFLRILQVR